DSGHLGDGEPVAQPPRAAGLIRKRPPGGGRFIAGEPDVRRKSSFAGSGGAVANSRRSSRRQTSDVRRQTSDVRRQTPDIYFRFMALKNSSLTLNPLSLSTRNSVAATSSMSLSSLRRIQARCNSP